jgi:DNA-directed RNA polymerase subunit M/transcription elongation factor TFIIS
MIHIEEENFMSKKAAVQVTCPACAHKEAFSYWVTINIDINPELNEKLIHNELNVYTCSQCGHRVHIEDALLYHNMKNRYMIWHIPAQDIEKECEEKNRMLDVPGGMGDIGRYTLRIVNERIDLLEKVMILDHRYDDRVIETMKVVLKMQLEKQSGGKPLEQVRFAYYDSEKDCMIVAAVLDGKRMPIQADRFMYQKTEELISRYLGEAEKWRYVGGAYGDELIERSFADHRGE